MMFARERKEGVGNRERLGEGAAEEAGQREAPGGAVVAGSLIC